MMRSDFKFIFFYCTLEIWKFALHSMRAPPVLANHGMTLKSFETILNIMHQEITFWPVSWGLRPLWNSMERDNEQQIVTPATKETLPKAQRTRGLSSSFQSNLLGHITSSNTNLDQISSSDRPTKHQPQNLDQTSASRLNLRFKILTKPNFITSTKHQREITDQTPASEHCLRAIFQSWFHLGIWHFQNT